MVQTKPRKESVAIENLERQGYIAYCPRIALSKRRRQRWQNIVEPLFPGYLFVQLSAGEDDFSPIRSTVGVLGLVRFGGRPAVISQSIINTIKDQEKNLLVNEDTHPCWKNGDNVEIVDGPFAGLKAVFKKTKGTDRIIVLLEILGHQNSVTLESNSVLSA